MQAREKCARKVAICIRASSEAQGERASPIDLKISLQADNREWIARAFHCPLKAVLPSFKDWGVRHDG